MYIRRYTYTHQEHSLKELGLKKLIMSAIYVCMCIYVHISIYNIHM